MYVYVYAYKCIYIYINLKTHLSSSGVVAAGTLELLGFKLYIYIHILKMYICRYIYVYRYIDIYIYTVV